MIPILDIMFSNARTLTMRFHLKAPFRACNQIHFSGHHLIFAPRSRKLGFVTGYAVSGSSRNVSKASMSSILTYLCTYPHDAVSYDVLCRRRPRDPSTALVDDPKLNAQTSLAMQQGAHGYSRGGARHRGGSQ